MEIRDLEIRKMHGKIRLDGIRIFKNEIVIVDGYSIVVIDNDNTAFSFKVDDDYPIQILVNNSDICIIDKE